MIALKEWIVPQHSTRRFSAPSAGHREHSRFRREDPVLNLCRALVFVALMVAYLLWV